MKRASMETFDWMMLTWIAEGRFNPSDDRKSVAGNLQTLREHGYLKAGRLTKKGRLAAITRKLKR